MQLPRGWNGATSCVETKRVTDAQEEIQSKSIQNSTLLSWYLAFQ